MTYAAAQRTILDAARLEQEQSMSDLIPTGGHRPVPIQVILDVVCRERRVAFQSLCGKERHPDLVMAREMFVWLCRELTFFSLPEIGMFMGGRNHSTIITQDNRIRERVAHYEWTKHGGQTVKLTDVLDELRQACLGEDMRLRREAEKARRSTVHAHTKGAA